MNVLHVINTLSAGGAELHLLTLCRYLKQAGVEVVVAYLKEGRGSRPLQCDFEAAGIPVFNLRGDGVRFVRPWLRLRRLLKQEKPDILHTHLPRADLLGFLACRSGFSGSWVCSVHGIYANHWRGRRALPLFGPVWRRADRIIAISKAVREWLVQGFGLPPEKVQVVYYGIELERWVSPAQDLRSAWGLEGRLLIGSVGRLEPVKGHDLLIRAMPAVVREFPQTTLLIAGHDPWSYGRVLERLVIQLGMDRHVRFLGFQSDIPSFLHSIDVFALASRSEGFGQVIIEAMAAGKPVVASKIAPLTEIIRHGETGLLVKPGDPNEFAEGVAWILKNPDQARQMGKRGQEVVASDFSAEKMANKITALYSELLNRLQ
ncbi:GDP-mannose-dependent alpha-(1-6)-phosphatidylinositol monomannoside mannosyltransferase [bacterium HR11]|nr:GDP-mannose-dependent alpha-(1-6)-phosphatidylinositol monomannoside mannosyltransferase [bacterium HR11]